MQVAVIPEREPEEVQAFAPVQFPGTTSKNQPPGTWTSRNGKGTSVRITVALLVCIHQLNHRLMNFNPERETSFLDLKQIKQIVDLMKRSSLTEFEMENEGFKLRIHRHDGSVPQYSLVPPMGSYPALQEAAPAAPPAASGPAEPAGHIIKSPMVGTFYSAPSPESANFVKSGDTVREDSIVCIIEAMKVMNEIKAEASGTIAEVLVQNGESVEFGQPLFRLRE